MLRKQEEKDGRPLEQKLYMEAVTAKAVRNRNNHNNMFSAIRRGANVSRP